MDGAWRPLCFKKQCCEGRKECDSCPFIATCRKASERNRIANEWIAREVLRDELPGK